LTVALRAFADLPGLVDADAVYSALAKLEQAGAETAGAVRVAAADDAPALGAVRQAVDESRQIWMRYYTASRDALTERIVDPIRLLVTDGHAYLEGYCHSADAVRHFRVDRIEDITVLDEPAQGQLWVDSDVPEKMFHPDPQIPPVTLRLAAAARWVAEYYQTEDAVELPAEDDETAPGSLRVRLRSGGDDWLLRLVLSLGGAAVIEDRPDLALRVSARAAEALEAYR
jgi:proteasome accessory factor C